MDYPKLRYVDVFPLQEEGLVGIRDPEGFSDKILVLGPEAVFVCSLFDGAHSVVDIQAEFTRRFNIIVESEKINELIDQLDRFFFLDNVRFSDEKKKIVAAFRQEKTRQATHAGTAYESDPAKIKSQLEGFFSHEDGPGIPDSSSPTGRISGLIAPHIDLHRGGICFAHSYAALAQESRADIFIILGISHRPASTPYILTEKDFMTPAGTAYLNRDIIDIIKKKCKTDFYIDEYNHKNEHSVEFQVLFLKHLYPDREITIVPVLCSFMEELATGNASPYENEKIREFIDTIRDISAEYGEKLCVIAGVDFSHIGQQFGQDIIITPEITEELEKLDREYIDLILAGDAEGFFNLVRSRKDSTNLCGTPALYTLLKVIGQNGSRLLKYGQAIDQAGNSIVSFAGAAYYR